MLCSSMKYMACMNILELLKESIFLIINAKLRLVICEIPFNDHKILTGGM